MANANIANIKPPKAPSLPIAPTTYSQSYFELFANALRLYFNQVDILCATVVTPDIGYTLNRPYGSFSATTTQIAAATLTDYAIDFDTANYLDSPLSTGKQPDMFISPDDPSVILIGYPSIYTVNFSVNLLLSLTAPATITVWGRLNGVDLDNSAFQTVLNVSGNNVNLSGTIMFECDATLKANSFQLVWMTSNSNGALTTVPAAAPVPTIPSATVIFSAASA